MCITQMVASSRVIWFKEKEKERGNLFFRVELFIKGVFPMTNSMERDS